MHLIDTNFQIWHKLKKKPANNKFQTEKYNFANDDSYFPQMKTLFSQQVANITSHFKKQFMLLNVIKVLTRRRKTVQINNEAMKISCRWKDGVNFVFERSHQVSKQLKIQRRNQ